MTNHKALLIPYDENKPVEEIDFNEDDFDDARERVCAVGRDGVLDFKSFPAQRTQLVYDDMGLYDQPNNTNPRAMKLWAHLSGIPLDNFRQPLVGNFIVLGITPLGDSADVSPGVRYFFGEVQMTKLRDITSRQLDQVKRRQFGWDDPCIICGQRFRFCEHQLDEAEEVIKFIQNLRHFDRAVVRNREREKQMAPTPNTKADELVAQAVELRKKALELMQTAKEIRDTVPMYQYPAKPTGSFFKIDVKFRTSQWNTYTYLVYMPSNVPGVFTTGQDERTTKFRDWKAFVDWLRDDDVVWNSGLDRLAQTGITVKLP